MVSDINIVKIIFLLIHFGIGSSQVTTKATTMTSTQQQPPVPTTTTTTTKTTTTTTTTTPMTTVKVNPTTSAPKTSTNVGSSKPQLAIKPVTSGTTSATQDAPGLAPPPYYPSLPSGDRMFKYLRLRRKSLVGHILVSWDIEDAYLSRPINYTLITEYYRIGDCDNGASKSRKELPLEKQVRSYELKDVKTWASLAVTIRGEEDDGKKVDHITETIVTHETTPTGNVSHITAISVQPTSAQLSWQPPTCLLRGGLLAHYDVEFTPVGQESKQRFFTTNAGYADFTDLTAYSKYQVRIRYVNGQGKGPFSPPYLFRTSQGPPGAPIVYNFTYDDISIGIVIVQPLDPNGQITQYHVQMTGGIHRMSNLYTPLNGTEYVIGRLSPATMYMIRARAKNAAGWGNWSHEIMVRTKREVKPTPQALRQTLANATCIGFRWVPPKGAEGTVYMYKIFVSTNDEHRSSFEANVDKSTTQFVQCGLNPYTYYSVTISVMKATGQIGNPLAARMWTESMSPPKPRPPVIRKTTTTTITVELFPVIFDQGPITTYEIRLLKVYHNHTIHDPHTYDPTERKEFHDNEVPLSFLEDGTEDKKTRLRPASGGAPAWDRQGRPIGAASDRPIIKAVGKRSAPLPARHGRQNIENRVGPNMIENKVNMGNDQNMRGHKIAHDGFKRMSFKNLLPAWISKFWSQENSGDASRLSVKDGVDGGSKTRLIVTENVLGIKYEDYVFDNSKKGGIGNEFKFFHARKRLKPNWNISDTDAIGLEDLQKYLANKTDNNSVSGLDTHSGTVHGRRRKKRGFRNPPGVLWMELLERDIVEPTYIIIGDGELVHGKLNEPLEPDKEYAIVFVVKSTVVDVTKHSYVFAKTTAFTKAEEVPLISAETKHFLMLILIPILLLLFFIMGFFVIRYLIMAKKAERESKRMKEDNSDDDDDNGGSDGDEDFNKKLRIGDSSEFDDPPKGSKSHLEMYFNSTQSLNQPRYITSMRDNIMYTDETQGQNATLNNDGNNSAIFTKDTASNRSSSSILTQAETRDSSSATSDRLHKSKSPKYAKWFRNDANNNRGCLSASGASNDLSTGENSSCRSSRMSSLVVEQIPGSVLEVIKLNSVQRNENGPKCGTDNNGEDFDEESSLIDNSGTSRPDFRHEPMTSKSKEDDPELCEMRSSVFSTPWQCQGSAGIPSEAPAIPTLPQDVIEKTAGEVLQEAIEFDHDSVSDVPSTPMSRSSLRTAPTTREMVNDLEMCDLNRISGDLEELPNRNNSCGYKSGPISTWVTAEGTNFQSKHFSPSKENKATPVCDFLGNKGITRSEFSGIVNSLYSQCVSQNESDGCPREMKTTLIMVEESAVCNRNSDEENKQIENDDNNSITEVHDDDCVHTCSQDSEKLAVNDENSDESDEGFEVLTLQKNASRLDSEFSNKVSTAVDYADKDYNSHLKKSHKDSNRDHNVNNAAGWDKQSNSGKENTGWGAESDFYTNTNPFLPESNIEIANQSAEDSSNSNTDGIECIALDKVPCGEAKCCCGSMPGLACSLSKEPPPSRQYNDPTTHSTTKNTIVAKSISRKPQVETGDRTHRLSPLFRDDCTKVSDKHGDDENGNEARKIRRKRSHRIRYEQSSSPVIPIQVLDTGKDSQFFEWSFDRSPSRITTQTGQHANNDPSNAHDKKTFQYERNKQTCEAKQFKREYTDSFCSNNRLKMRDCETRNKTFDPQCNKYSDGRSEEEYYDKETMASTCSVVSDEEGNTFNMEIEDLSYEDMVTSFSSDGVVDSNNNNNNNNNNNDYSNSSDDSNSCSDSEYSNATVTVRETFTPEKILNGIIAPGQKHVSDSEGETEDEEEEEENEDSVDTGSSPDSEETDSDDDNDGADNGGYGQNSSNNADDDNDDHKNDKSGTKDKGKVQTRVVTESTKQEKTQKVRSKKPKPSTSSVGTISETSQEGQKEKKKTKKVFIPSVRPDSEGSEQDYAFAEPCMKKKLEYSNITDDADIDVNGSKARSKSTKPKAKSILKSARNEITPTTTESAAETKKTKKSSGKDKEKKKKSKKESDKKKKKKKKKKEAKEAKADSSNNKPMKKSVSKGGGDKGSDKATTDNKADKGAESETTDSDSSSEEDSNDEDGGKEKRSAKKKENSSSSKEDQTDSETKPGDEPEKAPMGKGFFHRLFTWKREKNKEINEPKTSESNKTNKPNTDKLDEPEEEAATKLKSENSIVPKIKIIRVPITEDKTKLTEAGDIHLLKPPVNVCPYDTDKTPNIHNSIHGRSLFNRLTVKECNRTARNMASADLDLKQEIKSDNAKEKRKNLKSKKKTSVKESKNSKQEQTNFGYRKISAPPNPQTQGPNLPFMWYPFLIGNNENENKGQRGMEGCQSLSSGAFGSNRGQQVILSQNQNFNKRRSFNGGVSRSRQRLNPGGGGVSFSDEFKALEHYKNHLMKTLRFNVALRNPDKNRFNYIVTPDHTRVNVDIMTAGDSDYYNASYMDIQSDIQYIAAQSPFSQPLVETIVMLCNSVEGGIIKCEEYWAETGVFAGGPVLVETIEQEAYADYVVRKLKISSAYYREVIVTQFHFQTWPLSGVPDDPVPLLDLRYRVRRCYGNKTTPILVHCGTGVARTAVYIAVDVLIEDYAREGIIQVYKFVKKMRRSRPFMVRTSGQYTFIYECLFEEFQAGDTVVRTDLKDTYRALCQKNPQTGFTYLEDQFRLLCNFTPNIEPLQSKAGRLKGNIHKNVDPDMIPPDVYRPHLNIDGDPNIEGYINAVFVDGLRRKCEFIVTQTPLSNTVFEFWRTVYDYQVQAIVLFGNCKGRNQEQFFPKTGARQFDYISVEHVNMVIQHPTTVRNLKLCVTTPTGVERRAIRLFQVKPWDSRETLNSQRIENYATSKTDILDLLEMVTDWQSIANRRIRPVLVLDSDGATISGVFCACSVLCERMLEDQEVDLYHTVKHIKRRRPQFISDIEQYKFLHQVLWQYIKHYMPSGGSQDLDGGADGGADFQGFPSDGLMSPTEKFYDPRDSRTSYGKSYYPGWAGEKDRFTYGQRGLSRRSTNISRFHSEKHSPLPQRLDNAGSSHYPEYKDVSTEYQELSSYSSSLDEDMARPAKAEAGTHYHEMSSYGPGMAPYINSRRGSDHTSRDLSSKGSKDNHRPSYYQEISEESPQNLDPDFQQVPKKVPASPPSRNDEWERMQSRHSEDLRAGLRELVDNGKDNGSSLQSRRKSKRPRGECYEGKARDAKLSSHGSPKDSGTRSRTSEPESRSGFKNRDGSGSRPSSRSRSPTASRKQRSRSRVGYGSTCKDQEPPSWKYDSECDEFDTGSEEDDCQCCCEDDWMEGGSEIDYCLYDYTEPLKPSCQSRDPCLHRKYEMSRGKSQPCSPVSHQCDHAFPASCSCEPIVIDESLEIDAYADPYPPQSRQRQRRRSTKPKPGEPAYHARRRQEKGHGRCQHKKRRHKYQHSVSPKSPRKQDTESDEQRPETYRKPWSGKCNRQQESEDESESQECKEQPSRPLPKPPASEDGERNQSKDHQKFFTEVRLSPKPKENSKDSKRQTSAPLCFELKDNDTVCATSDPPSGNVTMCTTNKKDGGVETRVHFSTSPPRCFDQGQSPRCKDAGPSSKCSPTRKMDEPKPSQPAACVYNSPTTTTCSSNWFDESSSSEYDVTLNMN